MENEEFETIDSQNDTEETVNDTQDNTELDIDAEIKKATAPLYARMKKAEEDARLAKAKLAEQKPEDKTDTEKSLSVKDLIALTNAKIHEEDVGIVEEYARFAKISFADALKTSVVKTLISEKEEARRTANATNVSNSRRSTSRPSNESIIAKARAGEKIDDPELLAEAIMAEKIAKLNK